VLSGSCHCGAVRIEVPRRPRSLTDCNCSICRRYGTLWAYYKAAAVRVIAKSGAIKEYGWGRKKLRFVRCATCGCVTHWRNVRLTDSSRIGVNWRNFEPEAMAGIRVRRLDGASSWRYLD
jgi:hypothetical protein